MFGEQTVTRKHWRLGRQLWTIAAVGSVILVCVAGCSSAGQSNGGTSLTVDSNAAAATPSSMPSEVIGSSAPTASQTAEQTAPAQGAFFAVDGQAKLVTSKGYTVSLQFTWTADEPRIDVGSNPPGKTGIVMPDRPFHAVLTNTTAGGRQLPSEDTPDASLVALYPSTSAVCTQKDSYGRPDDTLLGGEIGRIRTPQTCGVHIIAASGWARGGGTLDVGATIPNGTPISYTFQDLAASGAGPEGDGRTWSGVDEAQSIAIRDALAHPVAFGLDTSSLKPQSASCTYLDPNDQPGRYIALLESNVGTTVPGC